MKIITILGSPHRNGNTAKILGWIEEELKSSGHEIDRINTFEHHINDCIACYSCQTQENMNKCAQSDDDVNSILGRMVEADAIVFSMPLYCGSFPAALKALFDRGMSHISLFEGKNVALLVTCGGPIEDNADLVGPLFDRISTIYKTKKVGELIVPFCRKPDNIGEEVKEKAKKLAHKLVAQ